MKIALKGKQGELFTLMNEDKNSCFVVSIRSGKTMLAFLTAVIQAQKKPNQNILYAAPTYPMLRDIVFKEFVPWLSPFLGTEITAINESDLTIYFANGSTIIFRSTDRPERIRGLTLDLAILDEAAIMKADVVYEIINRLAATPGRVRGRVIMISSPAGRNHFYDFIHGAPGFEGILSNEYWNYRRYTAYDMSVITETEIEMLKKTKSSATFAQDVLCDWTTLEGRIFKNWTETKHITTYKVDYQRPIWVGVDFNIAKMSAVAAQMIDNKIVIFDEILIEHGGTREMAEELRTRWGLSKLIICPDATGNYRKSVAEFGITDILLLKQALSGHKAEFRFGSQNPSVRDTINATNELIDHDRLLVTANCRNVVKSMINMVYKEDGQPFKDNIHDHHFDCVRYITAAAAPIKQEFEKVSQNRRISGRFVAA